MIKRLTSMVSFSLIAVLCTFSFQTIATHLLSVEDYGILGKWLTDLGYIGIFFILGLDSSILYHARLGESFEKNTSKNIFVYTLVLLLSITVITLFLEEKIYYLSLVFSIYSLAVINIFRVFFQFKETFKIYNYLTVLRPILVLLPFVFSLLANKNLTFETAVIYYCSFIILALIVTSLYYFKVTTLKKPENFLNLNYYKYGLKSILNKVLSLTLYASTIYCLSYFDDYEVLAYFFVASSISKMAWVLPDSAGNILYPKFLKEGSEYTVDTILKELFFYAQLIFLLNTLLLIAFIFLGNFTLKILYTPEYLVSYTPILILLVGNQGMVFYKLLSRYFASKNNWKPLYISLSTAIVVNIVGNFLLIPEFGIIGASIATSLSFWACGITASFFMKNSFIEFINLNSLLKNIRYRL